jgi:hypothetical protein
MGSSARRRKTVTASELLAHLKADPDWVSCREAGERHSQQVRAESRAAQAPLLEELESVGVHVSDVWDLVNTSEPYPDALPVLLKHLQLPYPSRVQEGIARALAVPPAAFGWPILMQRYVEAAAPDAKDGLAAALAVTATSDTLDELIALILGSDNGDSRLLLLGGLKRLRSDSRVAAALASLTEDPRLGPEARRLRRASGSGHGEQSASG